MPGKEEDDADELCAKALSKVEEIPITLLETRDLMQGQSSMILHGILSGLGQEME